MLFSRIGTRHLVLASLGLICAVGTASPSFAQDAPAANIQGVVETPIIPTTPFPSLIALDSEDSVWTLKVVTGAIRVNGDVAVNSPNKGAIWMSTGTINAQNGQVSVVGGVSRLGRNTIRPQEAIGGNVVSDPIPEFNIPSPTKVISQQKVFVDTDAEDDQVMPPGIYKGGIFASGKGHITLEPGVFVVVDGDFSVIGPTVEGEGVTIVMAGNNAGALSFSLGAKFNASAPTSGKLKDLLVVSRSSGDLGGVSFATAEGNMKGLIYTPNAPFATQYSKSVKASKIIAKSVSVTSGTLDVTGFTAPNEAPAAGDDQPAPIM